METDAEAFAERIDAEEAKRERNWRPGQRWAAILAAIDFADRQQPVRRNTRQRCLELQNEKLAAMRRGKNQAED